MSAKHIAIKRRTLLAGAAASMLAAPLSPRPAIAEGAKIRYTLSWLPTGQYAYVYMARQLGYWKKRGIEVDISSGRGSLGAIQGITSGQFEMGGAATGADLLSIIKGVDLRMVGTQGYDGSLGILVPAKGPIQKPKDLEGKTMGVTAAGGDTPFLPAYFKLAGVDVSKVTQVSLDSKIIEEAVISGRVDSMVAFGMSSIPNFITADRPQNIASSAFPKRRERPFREKGDRRSGPGVLSRKFLAREQDIGAVLSGTLLPRERRASRRMSRKLLARESGTLGSRSKNANPIRAV